MKEPKRHEPNDEDEFCLECDFEWPCPTWKKWSNSKDYRIQYLEAAVERLVKADAEQRTSIDALRVTVREQGLILQHGVLRAIADIGSGREAGRITVNQSTDFVDVTPYGGPSLRIPTLRHYDVHYWRDDREWVNGVEQ
ncbi:hypothetical protein [Streptomyces griseus]|uniref:hypothetical protein n=1 Tax=Streptomyces griseus TaxID=1911 RepID=UPI0033BFC51C